MAKRKKKWRRGQRNPGLTIVFSDRTRTAIESMAANGTAKSEVVKRLVETALGLTDANASTDGSVPAIAVAPERSATGDSASAPRVLENYVIEIELEDGRVLRGVSKGLSEEEIALLPVITGRPKPGTNPVTIIKSAGEIEELEPATFVEVAPPQRAGTAAVPAIQVAPPSEIVATVAAVNEEPEPAPAEPVAAPVVEPVFTLEALAPRPMKLPAESAEPAIVEPEPGDARLARGLLNEDALFPTRGLIGGLS